MSKRTQFRNQHRFRQLPRVVATSLIAAQVSVDAEPDKKKHKFLWSNALYGIAEWWKYRRLKALLQRMRHKPHQGEREKARRVRVRNQVPG
jgi:hypothetical protein